MLKTLRIDIPQPCHENWQAMTPAEQGRHCAACDKVVMDFTAMSEAEIKAFFAQKPKKTCGRFRPDQLRTYTLPTQGFRIGWRPALAAIGLGLSAVLAYPSVAIAQDQTAYSHPEQQGDTPKPNANLDVLHIKGQVLIQDNHETYPLPGVYVSIHTTSLSAITDIEGNFDLEIPEEYNQPETLIRVYYIGHNTKTYTLADLIEQSKTQGIVITLDEDDFMVLGKVVSEHEAPYAHQKSVSIRNWANRGWNWVKGTLFHQK